MNKVILIGRLTRDPDVSYTPNGVAQARFTLAVDRPYARSKNQNNQDPNAQTVDFIPVTVWRERAQTVGNYFHKGMRVMVEGRLQVRNYTAQDGTKKNYTDVLLDSFEFLETKRDSNQSPVSSGYSNQPQNYIAPPADDYPPDDDGGAPPEQIPF